MKKIVFTLAVLTLATPLLLAQERDVVVETNFFDPSTWLLGHFEEERFKEPPHDSWYLSGFAAYKPEEDVAERVKRLVNKEISVLIVSGTWCGDTRREVPRFMKLAELTGIESDSVRHLGVDLNRVAPVGNYEELNILRIPTFIIYRNNVEIGRIIEYPEESLERDLLKILSEEKKVIQSINDHGER